MTGTSAGIVIGLSEIKVPALGGTYRSNQYTKTRFDSHQSFYTVRTDSASKARTYGYTSNIGYSEWRNSVVGQEVYWSHVASTQPSLYRFELKGQNYNLLSFDAWISWTYNPA